MKRIVTASILTSLIAGSAAMAGTPPHWISDRARDQQGNNSQRDPGRNNDRNHGRDYSRDGDQRDADRGERRFARDPHPTGRQGDGRFNDRDRRDYDRRSDRNDGRYDNRYYGRFDHRDYRPDRYWRGEYQRPSGWYSHRWSRGERLPREYYGRPYIVYGYGDYGLYAPPRGYSWVRVDSDVVLTALATGLVLDVVYNQFY